MSFGSIRDSDKQLSFYLKFHNRTKQVIDLHFIELLSMPVKDREVQSVVSPECFVGQLKHLLIRIHKR